MKKDSRTADQELLQARTPAMWLAFDKYDFKLQTAWRGAP